MIRQLTTLIVIGLLVGFLVLFERGPEGKETVELALMLGFVLLASYLVGTIGERLRLPRITGYIVAGLFFGPYVLGFLDHSTLSRLNVFNDMALAFIGLAAGAELRMAVLRARAKSVFLLIVCTTAVVITGVSLVAVLIHPLIPAMAGRTWFQIVAMAALLGVVAAARSPSSAIAIISETRARGPFTETILGVAMSMDLLILPLFSVVAALATLAFSPGQSLNFLFLLAITAEILASVLLGVCLGLLTAAYIKYEGPKLAFVLVGLCFLVYKFSHGFESYLEEAYDLSIHLEPLVICAAAGFTIQNASRAGERLVEAMDSVGLPVYVIFFTMAGSGLNMHALASSWTLALVLVGARLLMIMLGSRIATGLAGDPRDFQRYSWMGFVTQAGLSIALATQLASSFGEWGKQLGTLLIAVIALNQVFGPIAFKFALDRVGETRAARKSAPEATSTKESTA